MYQELYNKSYNIIKPDACMKFYDALQPLYLEKDISSIGLEAGHLWIRDGMNCGWDKILDNMALCPIAFVNKSLSSMAWWYSSIEWDTLPYHFV